MYSENEESDNPNHQRYLEDKFEYLTETAEGFLASIWRCIDPDRVREALQLDSATIPTMERRRLFEVTRQSFEKDKAADQGMVAIRLKQGDERDLELATWVPSIFHRVDGARHLEHYREKLVEGYKNKHLAQGTVAALNEITAGKSKEGIKRLEKIVHKGSGADALPPIKGAKSWLEEDIPDLEPLLGDFMHKGGVYTMQAPSKSFKSFCSLQLSVSIASGIPFWGMKTTQSRVLYLNLEVDEAQFRKRYEKICNALGKTVDNEMFKVWNLRGCNFSSEDLRPYELKKHSPDFIVIDPLYQLATGLNENDVGEMGQLLNQLDRIVKVTGSALFYIHHFAKGNAAGKAVQDRGAGSGVLARHYDGAIYLTKHEDENHFVVQTVSRNTASLPDVVVRHDHPLTVIAPEADPARLEIRSGRKASHTKQHVLDLMKDDRWRTVSEIQEMAESKGMGRSTFYNLWKAIKASPKVDSFAFGNSTKYRLIKETSVAA